MTEPEILERRDPRKIGKALSRYLVVLSVRNRHSPEQIAAALRQAEAVVPIAEIVRKLAIHENRHLFDLRRPASKIYTNSSSR
jgi:hypothetical protein